MQPMVDDYDFYVMLGTLMTTYKDNFVRLYLQPMKDDRSPDGTLGGGVGALMLCHSDLHSVRDPGHREGKDVFAGGRVIG